METLFIISVVVIIPTIAYYFLRKSKAYNSSELILKIDSKLNKFEKKIGGLFLVAFLSIIGGIIFFIGFYFFKHNDLIPLAIFLIINGVVWGIISYIFF